MKLELNLNQHQTSKQESKINIKQPKRKANQAKRTYKQEAVPKHQTNKQLANKQRTNNNSKQNGKQYENKQIKVKAICQTPICWGGWVGWERESLIFSNGTTFQYAEEISTTPYA